jgi:hypothetical protein
MGSDMPVLSKIPWHYLIVDEGHRLKNSNCKLNAALKCFTTKHRLLLTGVLAAAGRASCLHGTLGYLFLRLGVKPDGPVFCRHAGPEQAG